jgi:hypothetical protein
MKAISSRRGGGSVCRRIGNRGWVAAVLLLSLAACAPGAPPDSAELTEEAANLLAGADAGGRSPGDSPDAAGEEEARWAVVQEYLDLQDTWYERTGDIRQIWAAEGTAEEKMRRAEEAQADAPDATAALAAARAIVAASGPRTIEAAEFLIARSRDPVAVAGGEVPGPLGLSTEIGPAEAGVRFRAAEDPTWEALITHVGPDWAVVADFFDERDAWLARRRVTDQADAVEEGCAGAPPRALGGPPECHPGGRRGAGDPRRGRRAREDGGSGGVPRRAGHQRAARRPTPDRRGQGPGRLRAQLRGLAARSASDGLRAEIRRDGPGGVRLAGRCVLGGDGLERCRPGAAGRGAVLRGRGPDARSERLPGFAGGPRGAA